MPTSSIDLRTKQWQLWDMKQIRQLSTKFWHVCKLKLVTIFQVIRTSEGDKSVPITWAYNHHYVSYLVSTYSKMAELEVESGGAAPYGNLNHGAPTFWLAMPDEDVEDPRPESHVPISQFFSEGNGGEFRYLLTLLLLTHV